MSGPENRLKFMVILQGSSENPNARLSVEFSSRLYGIAAA